MGRPKTMSLPGGERLRISSQSLKRAWRCSEVFQKELGGHLGTRTKEVGKYAWFALTNGVRFSEVLQLSDFLLRMNSDFGYFYQYF